MALAEAFRYLTLMSSRVLFDSLCEPTETFVGVGASTGPDATDISISEHQSMIFELLEGDNKRRRVQILLRRFSSDPTHSPEGV